MSGTIPFGIGIAIAFGIESNAKPILIPTPGDGLKSLRIVDLTSRPELHIFFYPKERIYAETRDN